MTAKESRDAELEHLLSKAYAILSDPSKGLPDPVFHFILKTTAVANVDLLVADENGRKMLTWREDEYGQGWHIPGGIVRWGETLENRIAEVARLELGATVTAPEQPGMIAQFQSARGTFISLLYHCSFASPVDESVVHFSRQAERGRHGDLHWFSTCPKHLYPAHKVYRHLLDAPPTHGAA